MYQNLKPTTTKNHCIKLWIANGEELTCQQYYVASENNLFI